MLPDNGRQVKQYHNYHITIEELKVLLKWVKMHVKDSKYEISILLMAFRGMRPSEALAVNRLDFNKDFTRLTYREAKTNKIRSKEVIIKPVARRIKAYFKMNKHRLIDGWLFPSHCNPVKTKKGISYYQKFMTSQSFADRFADFRYKIGKKYPSFNEKYSHKCKTGTEQWRYRINPYSLRRFFTTYVFINNKFNEQLVREIQEYSTEFDFCKHYIRIVHREEEKAEILENTFRGLANNLIEGQTQLGEYG